MAEVQELAARVKQIQRSDQAGKQAWWNYADQNGGVRDPAKHQAESLQSFLSQYDAGAFVGAEATYSDTPKLGDLFKEGQRTSVNFKTAWAAYNTMNGNFMNDPSKASKETLVSFLEFLGQLGVTALGSKAMGKGSGASSKGGGYGGKSGGWSGEGASWDSGSEWGGKGSKGSWGASGPPMKKHRVSSGDAVHDEAVEKIKQFQRSGDEQKQAWWNYCDAQEGRNRDPARHDTAVLQTFILDNWL